MAASTQVSELPFACKEVKIHRFNLAYKIYHLTFGIVALVGAVLMYRLVIPIIGVALFSMFIVSRPFRMAVIVDHNFVTLTIVKNKAALMKREPSRWKVSHK